MKFDDELLKDLDCWNRAWQHVPDRADNKLLEALEQMADECRNRWVLLSPDGEYVLTSKFKVAGLDFMAVETFKQQGIGKRTRLRELKKDSKAIYDPDTVVWFKLKVWHEGDTLCFVSDGNCFYFLGKFRREPVISTFVEDFEKYVVIFTDLACKLRTQVSNGLDGLDEQETGGAGGIIGHSGISIL